MIKVQTFGKMRLWMSKKSFEIVIAIPWYHVTQTHMLDALQNHISSLVSTKRVGWIIETEAQVFCAIPTEELKTDSFIDLGEF